jgi:predicted nucleic acid-binding protein
MGLILDTNALSAIADAEPGASALFSKARRVAIPVIVLGEFRFGIGHSRNKQRYERWLEELVSVCGVLVVDEETAIPYAGIRAELKQAGTPIPSNDMWIAALARQHALPVLSRDRHFDLVKEVQRVGW